MIRPDPFERLVGPRDDRPRRRSGAARGVANRARASLTTVRQPSSFARRQSASAVSTAPKTSRRGRRPEDLGEDAACRRARPRVTRLPKQVVGATGSSPSRTTRCVPSVEVGECDRALVAADDRASRSRTSGSGSYTATSISPPHGKPDLSACSSEIPNVSSRAAPPREHLAAASKTSRLDAAARDGAVQLAALGDDELRADGPRGGAARRDDGGERDALPAPHASDRARRGCPSRSDRSPRARSARQCPQSRSSPCGPPAARERTAAPRIVQPLDEQRVLPGSPRGRSSGQSPSWRARP